MAPTDTGPQPTAPSFGNSSNRARVTRGHGEGEGHLRLDAACGVHPVSEDEASSASAYAGFGVALAGAVVRGSLAVGFYVGELDARARPTQFSESARARLTGAPSVCLGIKD